MFVRLLFALGLVLCYPILPECRAQPRPPYAVKVIQNVAYHNGADADPVRHKLDLYLPEGKTDAPVLFYVHGGAWTIGDKNQFGIPGQIGKIFAKNGIAMVAVNYRLSPKVKHPEHIRDVAKAFAWTHQNIAKYGGCPDDVFVWGHSAGGHLVALLATDDRYLKEHSLTLNAIRGAIPMSGVFTITGHKILENIFGNEPEGIKLASPITHVRPDVPPFLILFAESELPGCDKLCAQAFYQALKAKKAPVELFEAKNRNHISILFQAVSEADPVNQAVMSFIISHVTMRRLASDGPAGIDLLGQYITGGLAKD